MEAEGESDTIVRGTADVPMLQLDPGYYGENREVLTEHRGIIVSPRLNIPRDRNSLLARSLLSKVVAGQAPVEGLLDDQEGKGSILLARVGDKSSLHQRIRRDASVRDLSRGARARLSRYGFDTNTVGASYICQFLNGFEEYI